MKPLTEGPRLGKDELNLAEFPIALLHSRPPKNAPLTLEFRDGEREWTVEGSPKFGLPLAPDVEVYVILMEASREKGFPQRVEFCRRELIQRLGWDPNGRSYERLTLALDRLVSVTIRTRNAFYDADRRHWSSKEAFHILERYKILDGTVPGNAQPTLFPSWIEWSSELYANIRAGYIKSLNVDLYLSLKSGISQALYRYLDKKRGGDGKPVFRIAVRTLCFEHLGLSRTYYPSEAKFKLKPAHEELTAAGFLAGVEYAPMKNGEEMVIYHFGAPSRPARPAKPLAAPEAPPLVRALMAAGLSRRSAQELAAGDPEECRRQLEYLPHRPARDPGAVLGKSIREGWSAPPAWQQAQEKAKAAEGARAKAASTAAVVDERAAEENRFDEWWRGLSPERREEYTVQAAAALRQENPVLYDMTRRRPDSPMRQAALRPYLKQCFDEE